MRLNETAQDQPKHLVAVCFDFRGVIVDHRNDTLITPGIEGLLSRLKERNIKLAIISSWPIEIVDRRLGSVRAYFGDNLYNGRGAGKLDCIRAFVESNGIADLSAVAFVDDKPANLLPVAEGSTAKAIGFRGSGKYPEAADECKKRGIPYAYTANDLAKILCA